MRGRRTIEKEGRDIEKREERRHIEKRHIELRHIERRHIERRHIILRHIEKRESSGTSRGGTSKSGGGAGHRAGRSEMYSPAKTRSADITQPGAEPLIPGCSNGLHARRGL
jgi:hypothetical protein